MTYSSVFCSINKEKTKEIKKEKAQQRRKRATIEAKSLQVWQRIIGYKRNSSSREIRAKEVHRHASNFTIRSWGVFGKIKIGFPLRRQKRKQKKKTDINNDITYRKYRKNERDKIRIGTRQRQIVAKNCRRRRTDKRQV